MVVMNITINSPTWPDATVNAAPPVITGVPAVIPVPTIIVTVLAPAELSTVNVNLVPRTALIAAPSNVAVGNVRPVAAADVDVMYLFINCAAVSVAVALAAKVDAGDEANDADIRLYTMAVVALVKMIRN